MKGESGAISYGGFVLHQFALHVIPLIEQAKHHTGTILPFETDRLRMNSGRRLRSVSGLSFSM
jgi:hypothetical protein